MRRMTPARAAGETDPGRHRQVNEDRFHVDSDRGFFMVVDGVGGQAAGGKAADVALSVLRQRLERDSGTVEDRIREGITAANNEICRMAALRPEWRGMACVLTVAAIDGDRAIVGHVGDTRLYKLRHGRIEKITRDHSPVGEREDAKEISEAEAMKHPRRNEVYRDVGSERHQASDEEFIDLHQLPFEPDAALLLCSDGLSDLVPSASMAKVIRQCAGDPRRVARALVDMANDAGGKDNVTVVYVEGEDFPGDARTRPSGGRWRQRLGVAAVAIVSLAAGVALGWTRGAPLFHIAPLVDAVTSAISDDQVVGPTGSIMAAIARAAPGSNVVVEPGEYREQLVLKDRVRVLSRVPRGAVLRLPVSSSENEAAIIASGLSSAEISGFRILGDAATPLGTGSLVQDAAVAIVDVEIAGATGAALDIAGVSEATLIGSEIHDNPGAAMTVRAGSSPRITQNAFLRNGLSEHAAHSFVIEPGAFPQLRRNLFHGTSPDVFGALDELARQALTRDNWFIESRKSPARSAGGRQGRP